MASKYTWKPLLLSGGLDSSIICSLIKPELSIVISLGSTSNDLSYSRIVAQKYSKRHIEKIIDFQSFERLVPHVIRILKTFDPIEVRNSSVLFAGILEAKNRGCSEVVTGDGADELFAGYNYLQRYFSDLGILQSVLVDLWKYMHFSSLDIGSALGLTVYTPYIEEPFLSYAKGLDIREKVGREKGSQWGKYILRKAFEFELGSLVWRRKMALEKGSKMHLVTKYLKEKISEAVFKVEKKRYLAEQVSIRNKEQMYYYQIYRTFFSPPRDELCKSIRCPYCAACITKSKRYCNSCGAYPLYTSK